MKPRSTLDAPALQHGALFPSEDASHRGLASATPAWPSLRDVLPAADRWQGAGWMSNPDGLSSLVATSPGFLWSLPPWPYDPDDPNAFKKPEWWGVSPLDVRIRANTELLNMFLRLLGWIARPGEKQPGTDFDMETARSIKEKWLKENLTSIAEALSAAGMNLATATFGSTRSPLVLAELLILRELIEYQKCNSSPRKLADVMYTAAYGARVLGAPVTVYALRVFYRLKSESPPRTGVNR